MTLAYLLQTIVRDEQMNVCKHLEIINDSIRIYTTVGEFLTCANQYQKMYNAKVKDWYESENDVIAIL